MAKKIGVIIPGTESAPSVGFTIRAEGLPSNTISWHAGYSSEFGMLMSPTLLPSDSFTFNAPPPPIGQLFIGVLLNLPFGLNFGENWHAVATIQPANGDIYVYNFSSDSLSKIGATGAEDMRMAQASELNVLYERG